MLTRTTIILAEAAGIFVDTHWIEGKTKTVVPKSVLDRLKPLETGPNFEKIASASYLARRQLHTSMKTSTEEQVLDLGQVMKMIRDCLEVMSSTTEAPEKFQQMYGSHVYKCPRLSCVHFYNGFATSRQRDDHVPKHERSYFCSFLGCPFATLGCATLKDLQKHETDFHGTISLDDEDAEFPEMPPEKSSFDCDTCGATFTRKHNLKNHTRLKHSGPNIESFICTTCGKRFARQGDRTRHESTSHSSAKKFACGGVLKNGSPWGCGREFNRGDVLSRHWKSEKGRACIRPKQEEEELETPTSTSTPLQQPNTPLHST